MDKDPEKPPDGRLIKVYPPEDVYDNTAVDILAIHGLGTTTPRTWEYKTGTGSVNWLSDPHMLPSIVPSARIYTFSWNANYSDDASVVRIHDVAGILLNYLKNQRDKENAHTRPLIFIGSCFGGLIVTKAFEIANIHGSVYRVLLLATSGVVFLGSPLQGTRAAKAAEWHTMIAGMLNRNPSQTLLQDLNGSTRTLRETTHRFLEMITTPPMQIMTTCFWETQKSQVLKAVIPAWIPTQWSSITKMILVEEDSATLMGRDNKPLDAPHTKMNKFDGPNNANFVLVSNDIQKMVNHAKKISVRQREAYHLHNEHFLVMRRPSAVFTGREEELERLKQALCPSVSPSEHTANPKIYVIHGMGGAGKSEVAVKFAFNNRAEFWGIFWIDARSEASITNGFANVARKCGQHDGSLDDAILWLQDTHHSWLLILDNADNADLDLARFLPAGRNGSILITTRVTECAKYQTAGNSDCYERLSQETAMVLFLKACGIETNLRGDHEEDAHAIIELLGCHALAIIQAGAAISQGLCELQDYKDMFLDQRRMLFDIFPKQARSEYGGVYATFEVSANYLKTHDDEEARDALELLNFYASVHFSDFPEAAFEEAWKNSRDGTIVSSELNDDGEEYIDRLSPWHVSHLPTFMTNNSDNINQYQIRLRIARSLLVSLSIVAFDSTRGVTRMHPVTHFWSKDRLTECEPLNAGRNALCVLSLSIKDPYTVDTSQVTRQLQPHIKVVASNWKEWDPQHYNFHFQQSVYRLVWTILQLQFDLAPLEMLQMIPVRDEKSWIRTANGLDIQNLHGLSLNDFGDASKAVSLLKQVSEARAQTLAPENPKYLISQRLLALAYLQNDDTIKAIEILEQIARTQNETLSLEDESLLYTEHDLARAYLKVEALDKAIPLLEHVVEIESKSLGPTHPDRSASQHELARAYLSAGETAKAIALLESVVEIEASILRPDHPDRLSSQHELARAYLRAGETAKAMALLKLVVEIRTRILRPDHPRRLVSQYILARAYLEQGNTAHAITLLESVVGIEAESLRPDHRDRVRSVYTLAQSHRKAGSYERALQLARSIEDVAQNEAREKLADWNAQLIGFILEDMRLEEVD